jgi:hypothetical protein
VTTPDDNDMSGNAPSNPSTSADAAGDDPVIASMVRDAGGDGELSAALEHIRTLRAGSVPTPSPELAALLADGLPGGATPKGRMRPGHRALLGVILIGGLGTTAAGTAFAEEGIRRGAATVFANVINMTPFGMPLPVAAPTEKPATPRPIPGPPGPDGSGSETTEGGAGQANGPNPESPPSGPSEGGGGASGGSPDPGGTTPPSTGPDTPGGPSDGGSAPTGADEAQPRDASSTN